MAIVAEFCRKQFFTGEISPGELCKTVCKPENLISFGSDELQTMIKSIQSELSAREKTND